MQDGGGFRSRLVVTNLSEAANRCTMKLRGHMNTARFENVEGVVRNGFREAELELAADGGQLALSSRNRNLVAFGHAALECEGPADLRNVLTAHSADGPAGIAVVSPADSAREFRFPVPELPVRVALAIANESAAEVSCMAELAVAGREAAARGRIAAAGRGRIDGAALSGGLVRAAG